MENALATIRKLSKESSTGLLISYKALKKFHFDYEQALLYLKKTKRWLQK